MLCALSSSSNIRYHISEILANHWNEFVSYWKEWIRPVVFENVRKVLACRTPVLGCHIYHCNNCGHVELVPHSCKSRFCPTCGKHAADVWCNKVLNSLLDVPYHHLVLTIPWQLRRLILMNREEGLNLLCQSATLAISQWAHDVKKMRMGIVLVIHTFGSDLKWHPHIHLIVTGGGLSLDGKCWLSTDPKYLMNHNGLKKRWRYQVITRLKKGHRKKKWRFPKSQSYFKKYYHFAGMLNQLWRITWYAYIGASLLDPRFSVRYIGRYTKRAVIAEYRIVAYSGKSITFSYKDYAEGGKLSFLSLRINTFIGRLIRHIPDKYFPMIRYCGIFSNRWKDQYLALASIALNPNQADSSDSKEKSSSSPASPSSSLPSWAKRQTEYTGINPLICPNCNQELAFVGAYFGNWKELQLLFETVGKNPVIPLVLLPPG
jgi:hypothetical protein